MNLSEWLSNEAHEDIIVFSDEITKELILHINPEFLISYNYRYIIKKEVINLLVNRAINLHISFLPWNRGADPNLWSFLEDTPKGVTIHHIACGIDTGDIITQRTVDFEAGDTLKTSYYRLSKTITDIFCETWPYIRKGKIKSFKQPAGGTYHRKQDRAHFEHLLTKGWDTPVADLIGKALNQ